MEENKSTMHEGAGMSYQEIKETLMQAHTLGINTWMNGVWVMCNG